MDELTSKLKKLWKPKPKTFKGKGNILGRAEEAPKPSRPPPKAPSKQSPPPEICPTTANHASSSQPVNPLNESVRVVPASELAAPSPGVTVKPGTAGLHEHVAAHFSSPGHDLDAEELQQIEQAAALFLSSQQGGQSTGTIGKILGNIVAQPADAKYRRLRLSNKRIQETIVDIDGGVELLQACGFELVFEEAGGEAGATEGFAVLPEHADLAPLQAALQLLGCQVAPEQTGQGAPAAPSSSWTASSSTPIGHVERAQSDSASSAPPQQPAKLPASEATKAAKRPRNTQVFFPAEATGHSLPKWFFDRSPSEVKSAFCSRQKKMEVEQTLMTRAYREKLNSSKPDLNGYASATIRIRLPEGLVLQGEFDAGEPIAAMFEWLGYCLRDPGCEYELVGPDRKPVMPATGSMRKAQLVPSALLNFRRLSAAPQQEPTLRQDVLRLTQ